MEYIEIDNVGAPVSRVGLGTAPMGDHRPGSAEEREDVATIRAALERGVTVVDTAPLYGEGRAEEILGRALREQGRRERVVVVTKCGLEWWREDGELRVRRNSRPEHLRREIEASLRRLQTDYVDVYLIHWPDPETDIASAAETLLELRERGLVRALGVSNFSIEQMRAFRSAAPLAVVQPPFNLYERRPTLELLPYARRHGIRTVTYSVLSRGLLTGGLPPDLDVSADPRRRDDPKFQPDSYPRYLDATRRLDRFAREHYGRPVIQLALRWALDSGADVPLWGAHRPDQLEPITEVWDWRLDQAALAAIDDILAGTVGDQASMGFMAPD